MLNGKIGDGTVETLKAKETDIENGSVEEMPRRRRTTAKKRGEPRRRRIHNPKTGRYYQIRLRSSSKGRRGNIMGTWSPPTEKKPKKKRE